MAASFDVVSPLELVLPKWFELIQAWASDGSLQKVVEGTILRDPKDSQVKIFAELLDEWSAGNFKSLPAVELEAASSINANPVCSDRALNKILFNKNWSAAVSVESVLIALTQGLGNFLDNQLNHGESPEDEGKILAASLLGTSDLPRVSATPTSIIDTPPKEDIVAPIDDIIIIDGEVITISARPDVVLEDSGSALVYTFTRSSASTTPIIKPGPIIEPVSPLTVYYSIGGTATLDVDYKLLSDTEKIGTVTFAPGSSVATVKVVPIADSLRELDESVVLSIVPASGYSIGWPSKAEGIIRNDDKLFCTSFELLFLQDLSGSFWDDLPVVRKLLPDIIAEVNSLQPNTPIGISSFIDKPIAPFGIFPDYVYKTDQSLTTDITLLQNVYNNLVIGNGYDTPESQLEALLQVALRPTEIGFSLGSKRVVILFTDATYHLAGDGAAAGITLPNNLDAILDGTPPGTGEDYPGIASLRQKLIDANVLPIFAVT
ncbi:MAG: hypothetical protein ACK550_15600, partial [Synechococcaceae cyanobacterium]